MPVVPSLKLPFSFSPKQLQADLSLIAPAEWIPHFNKPHYEGEWSGVVLRSAGGRSESLRPEQTGGESYADTPLMERCAYFREVMRAWQCPLESVRLLKLAPRSSIREHTDYKLGYEDGYPRIHIPLETNPEVKFYLEDQLVNMQVGESWYLNLNLKHRVDNHSATDRVHLIIDCVVNDWMRDLFAAQGA